ncbi:hypothetical protein T10_2009 [Trichinella papuae]|uniref:Uncharacterized protein n=1 Tax=Trichinella papuae TaxID=268474 RepID=A0A0V1MY49_9BILA|nr:hypothetical protein T10_2009 [Trichinella papuae]
MDFKIHFGNYIKISLSRDQIRHLFCSNIALTYSNPHFCKTESRVPAYSGNCWYTAVLKVSANISTMSFRLFVKEP